MKFIKDFLPFTRKSTSSERNNISKYGVIISAIWFLLVAGSLLIFTTNEKREYIEINKAKAVATWNKDLVYRRWVAKMGGVYVNRESGIEPNFYLRDIPNRDITTENGMSLTLINPAYMTRLVLELSDEQYGLKGHLTSLNLLRKENAPDQWEKESLKLFEKGVSEVTKIENIDGKPYLRYMKVVFAEKGCLKCHEHQGYKEGDVRGGISVSVPLESLNSYIWNGHIYVFLGHLVFLFAGFVGIALSVKFLNKERIRKDKIKADLKAHRESLEITVKKRTSELKLLNSQLMDEINERRIAEEQVRVISRFPAENPNPVMRIDENGFVLYANNASEYLLKEWKIESGGKMPDFWNEYVDQIKLNNEPVTVERTFDNKYYTFQIYPVVKYHYYNLYVTEITERKNAERKLVESEQRWRLVFNNTKDAIFWADVNSGEIIKCNRAAEELLELDSSEILGKHHSTLHPENKRDLYFEMFRDHVDMSGAMDVEAEVITKTGKTIPVHITSSITEVDGEIINQGIFRDISHRKEIEEMQHKLYEQEKMAAIGRVAGKMAHDINNVLSVSLSMSDLILHTHDLSPSLKAEIETIKGSAERGAEITKNLLFFAKDQEVKYTQFDLNEKIFGILKTVHEKINGIQITTNFDKNLMKMIADAGMVENILLNLIFNAVDAMSKTEEPKLSIQTTRKSNKILIVIKDNGCGIPKEYIDKVFDVSFTMKGSMDKDNVYADGIRGSGYGLTNVKKSIDKHGGSVIMESIVMKGTTVIIEFPVVDAELALEAVGHICVDSSIKGKRILIVEDEPDLGNVLYKLLGMYNHKVSFAKNGKEALSLFEENEYDAVSLDYLLPDMNGMEVYRKFRKSNINVPIIFVSGNFEFMQSMIDLKNNDEKVDHLPKPFINIDYVNKIHEWLKK